MLVVSREKHKEEKDYRENFDIRTAICQICQCFPLSNFCQTFTLYNNFHNLDPIVLHKLILAIYYLPMNL